MTNIASTCKTKTVVDHGAVPALVRNLRHHNPDLREQCAWCLGNIAGDCAVRVLVLFIHLFDFFFGALLLLLWAEKRAIQRAYSSICRNDMMCHVTHLRPEGGRSHAYAQRAVERYYMRDRPHTLK